MTIVVPVVALTWLTTVLLAIAVCVAAAGEDAR